MIANLQATAASAGTTLISAPPAGQAIYLQTVSLYANGQTGEVDFIAGGVFIGNFTLGGTVPVAPLIFPGGYKTTGAVSFTAPGVIRITVTYTIGPA